MRSLFSDMDDMAKQKAEEIKAKKDAKKAAEDALEKEEKKKKNPLL